MFEKNEEFYHRGSAIAATSQADSASQPTGENHGSTRNPCPFNTQAKAVANAIRDAAHDVKMNPSE
ncbi:hypothetical protein ELG83_24430 (plasmid) [Rhizobium leguminosarum]|uniref:hypothetical protein n=1 Tax=Rhizobium TaxID=379 RepID=UPI001030653C|nr:MULTISPECIES: hypothetical protein [Rhizobium]MBY5378351.1 hypothetical protein [Rhizobium leguminosarum]MBY5416488.1 hypothetical protein [Rhizobium leguminosarum]TBF24926.1 hypothetical protein ELG88_34070 [Rhizobium leguminosarum]TBF87999.1 hypothetical protein ELG83_24430 [Rhizobium leguminosarum]WSH48643.1 hypothetical protein U8P77_35630 [Rhizobium johnstonii]